MLSAPVPQYQGRQHIAAPSEQLKHVEHSFELFAAERFNTNAIIATTREPARRSTARQKPSQSITVWNAQEF